MRIVFESQRAINFFILWVVFVADITRALIGQLRLNFRALFSLNAHGPITGLQKKKEKGN